MCGGCADERMSMYKLVIVDDEPFIVQLIEKLIDHDRLDIQVVGTATDGVNALDLVRVREPDILITDIRMPCMDGLALIDHLKQSAPQVSIIAISGYRRFDYAYNALKGGVEDYLIKPIGRQDLNTALEKVCLRLSERQNESDGLKKMEAQIAQNAKQLRSKLILDCLGHRACAESIEQLNRDYLYHFSPGYFAGIAIRIDLPETEGIYGPIFQICEDQIQSALGDLCADMEFIQAGDVCCGIVNTGAEATHLLVRRIKILFEKLLIALEPYEATSVSIGLGSILPDCKSIVSSLCAARLCADAKCILGENRIYYSEKLDLENLFRQIQPVQADSLRRILDTGHLDPLRPWLESIFPQSMVYYQEHPVEALSLIASIMRNFTMICNLLNIDTGAESQRSQLRSIYQGYSLSETLDRLYDYMARIVLNDRQHRLEQDSYPIQRAKQYIGNNLSAPLGLKEIAEYVMLNPNYLSKLFKEETGTGISEYILSLRLEQAMLLLRTTSLNINQIADRVGYQDAKHFSKLFRKSLGIQMQDYRKMYSK